jgi:hypothetical protein
MKVRHINFSMERLVWKISILVNLSSGIPHFSHAIDFE